MGKVKKQKLSNTCSDLFQLLKMEIEFLNMFQSILIRYVGGGYV